MNLWDILSGAGYVLDTPGALTRGVIGNIGDLVSGKNRTKGYRATGREMLESLGILGPNREGFDAGDVAGGVADLVVDPVNVLSGYGAWKGAKAVGRMLKGRKTAAAADPITEAVTSRALVPVKQAANPIEEAIGMAPKAAAAPKPAPGIGAKSPLDIIMERRQLEDAAEDFVGAFEEKALDAGARPSHVVDKFFRDTYPTLTAEQKAQVDNGIQRTFGIKLGDVIGVDRNGVQFKANSMEDIAKLGISDIADDFESLAEEGWAKQHRMILAQMGMLNESSAKTAARSAGALSKTEAIGQQGSKKLRLTARPKPTLEVKTKTAERFAKEFRKGEITADEAEAAIRSGLGQDELVKNRMALHRWHERYTKSDDWEDIWDNEVDAAARVARENLVQLFRQMIEKGRRT